MAGCAVAIAKHWSGPAITGKPRYPAFLAIHCHYRRTLYAAKAFCLALIAKAGQTPLMSRPLIYGQIPLGLADMPEDGLNVSPLFPSQAKLESLEVGVYTSLFMYAPANTAERGHDIALGLRALAPGSPLAIVAPKDKGGSRLAKELADFGVMVADTPKRHHRICQGVVPQTLRGIEAAIAKGAMQRAPKTGLMGQPGIFSWDRLDPGTALLIDNLPNLWGHVGDFGCGTGLLSLAALKNAKVKSVTGFDSDRRAIEACALNIADARFATVWTDLRTQGSQSIGLDFVVCNPPFHDKGIEDQSLGLAFIKVAAHSLRNGGALWLTANRHLPYEAILGSLFKSVNVKAQGNGYKVFEAIK
jgi:16S rRNA (guanine1207-N2)-methyltransferase